MAKSSPPTQAQSLRRHLEETSRDLAAAQAGFDQTADRRNAKLLRKGHL